MTLMAIYELPAIFPAFYRYFQMDVPKMNGHLIATNDAGITISLRMFQHCRGRIAKLVFKGFTEMKRVKKVKHIRYLSDRISLLL